MRLVLLVVLLSFMAVMANCEAILFDNNSKVNIICEKDSIESERYAANELIKYFKQMTGADFSLSGSEKKGVNIYVGQTATVKKLMTDFDWNTLKTDGIIIKSINNNIILAGDRPRGTIYAVYEFLEDNFGIRFWTSKSEYVPTYKKLILKSNLNTVYKPPFIKRDLYSEDLSGVTDFKAKIKLNGDNWAKPLPNELGGSVKMGTGHSFTNILVKPDKYFKEHPEYYALRPDGNGNMVRKPAQLCLTNPEVIKVAAKDAIEYFDENPDIGYLSMGENDNNQQCMCENCIALRFKEESQSAVAIDFSNKVIDLVKQQRPDNNYKYSFLAYWMTERPPKTIKPCDDLLIIYAMLDRNHAFGPEKSSPRYTLYLKKWKELAKNVYIWDYYAHFGNFLIPHPNYFTPKEFYKEYADDGVTGVFVQNPFGTLADDLECKSWVQAKLVWNPNLDVYKLTKEFCNGYYGRAGKYIYDYKILLVKSVQKDSSTWLGLYDNNTSHWLDAKTAIKAMELMNKALNSVKDNPELTNRVKIAKSPIDLVFLQRYNEFKSYAIDNNVKWLGPKDPWEGINDWEKLVNDTNCKTYREWDDTVNLIKDLRGRFSQSYNIPEEIKNAKFIHYIGIDQMRGTKSGIVEDKEAAGGRAMVIDGFNGSQALGFLNPEYGIVETNFNTSNFVGGNVAILNGSKNLVGKWTVYASVKVIADSDTIDGAYAGVYSPYEYSRATIPTKKGEGYKLIKLGEYNLNDLSKVWVMPGSISRVSKIYVDRFILVK